MRKKLSRVWIIITIAICGLFIVLFLPLSLKSVGAAKAVSYTLTGVAVIWIVYFVRAHIISGFKSDKKHDDSSLEEEQKSENPNS